ncbi:hypothetical protein WOLCODRAFT_103161 [Wolfiporia cocos MD-104 SS10]|uniref:Fe2OG dioxygenase domain-containing protein n=1 Tax=Wolfiporia cocos (strain MD-104) TaxID=742152 RepID=A0A2H3K412_WOLCO|nr:hypothetical protein WOLCODRAFT_103161 [Wolfiporia cocos MD-104 SS10]
MTSKLEPYRVPNTDAVYYIADFISTEEEAFLVHKINESPLPKWKQLSHRRRAVLHLRFMTAKRVLIPEAMPSFVDKYPDIVGRIRDTGAFGSSPHGGPNHILMNEYLPGQGIMPHEDGSAYYPVVATLSLGSHAMFHYYRYKESLSELSAEDNADAGRAIDMQPVLSVLLEPRSLVVTTSSLYTNHLHGIDGVIEDILPPPNGDSRELPSVRIANAHMLTCQDERHATSHGGSLTRGTRYSLTCRDVEKIAGGLPFGKR